MAGIFSLKDWIRNGRIRRQLGLDAALLEKMKGDLSELPGRERLKLHIDRTAQQLVALEEPWRLSEIRMRSLGGGLVSLGVLTAFAALGYSATNAPSIWTEITGRLPGAVGLVGMLLLYSGKRLRTNRQEAAIRAVTGEGGRPGRSDVLWIVLRSGWQQSSRMSPRPRNSRSSMNRKQKLASRPTSADLRVSHKRS